MHILEPQLRRTSEVRYHRDLAPGRRFVFVGRVIDPICRLYIVGRQVDDVPADQPEWLDDHRHNCATFYVLIGRTPDLTGLTAEVVIEGRRFVAESPSTIMLPPGFLHHHRLIEGGGWSFHVNTRPDYEESLLGLPAAGDLRTVSLDTVYRRAERDSPLARDWEIESGAMTEGPSDLLPPAWKFIDPRDFELPGVRLHAEWFSSRTRGWNEAVHHHGSDEATILLGYGPEPLVIETRVGEQMAAVRSPVSLYVPAGLPHGCRHAGGEGLALKFLQLPSAAA